MPPQQSSSYALPIAILLGFAIVAAVIFFANFETTQSSTDAETNIANRLGGEPSTVVAEPGRELTEADFIRGNPNAPIKLVTYTDFECSGCEGFHYAMNRLIQEYGMSGQVAWVQRHMPLEDVHENSMTIANAAECVGSLAGNRAYWNFADQVFDNRTMNERTDMNQLPEYLADIDIDEAEWNSCVEDQTHHDYLTMTTEEALDAGAVGVPYTIILAGGEQGSLNGPQPYVAMRDVVERLFAQIEEQYFDEDELEAL